MKRPNALHPSLMTPLERRTALCGILALGLVRLIQRERAQHADETGESSLHFRPDQSGSPTATRRRPA